MAALAAFSLPLMAEELPINVEKTPIKSDEVVERSNILLPLLEANMDILAIDLLDNFSAQENVNSYVRTGNGNVNSDIIHAIVNNKSDYLLAAIPYISNPNEIFKYNNFDGLTLFLLIPYFPELNDKKLIIDALILAGSDINMRYTTGQTARDMAKLVGNENFELSLPIEKPEIFNLLEDETFFKNKILSEADQKMEKRIINDISNDEFLTKYIDNKDLGLRFYISLIKDGFNGAADALKDRLSIDASSQTLTGITPLMGASMSKLEGGNVEYTLKLIQEYKVDVNQVSKKSFNISALSVAAKNDNYKVATVLIMGGSKVLSKDLLGKNAFLYAAKYESKNTSIIMESFIKERVDKLRKSTI